MVFSVNYPMLRRMLGYADAKRLHYTCPLMTSGILVCLLISWMSMFNNITRSRLSYTMVYKLTKVYTNDTCHKHAQEYRPLAY